jgi:FtsP/CotA-like multicopper oxidase with cupredoxin domain
MLMPISRRKLLSTGIAAAAAAAKPAIAAAAAQRLTATTRTLDVNGKPARVFGLIGPGGKPGLTLAPGERFRVDLANTTDVPTIIHWHGQIPPWKEDGFPWPQTPPLPAKGSRRYDFEPISGTYWMHSHHGLQEQSLMTAPLIVRSRSEAREDRQPIVLMLHDFSFRAPAELLAGLTGTTAEAAERMATRTENVPAPSGTAGAGNAGAANGSAANGGAANGGSATPAVAAGASDAGAPTMRMPGGMPRDLNDIDYDAFLANDRTLADPQVVRVSAGARVRLRIINAASSSQFWIDLGRLTGKVVAVDGHAVHPVTGARFPLAIAQRLDILLDLPGRGAFPIVAEIEGRRARTGIILATADARIARIENAAAAAPALDNSLEARLSAVDPLPARGPDVVHRIVFSGTMRPYAWALNGQFWPEIEPLMLRKGQRVEIELANQTMMAHPMHLHGHAFQVTGLDGKAIAGAVRDTVLVPPLGNVRFAFDADNPGRWAFHCHNLYHMATGMITEFRYDGVPL